MQWAESLIHFWTVTERIVEVAWEKVIISVESLMSKARRNFLNDHRTWPVSTKLELLFQRGILPARLRDKLNDVRKARNAFAHDGIPPTQEIATKALSGCFEFASLCASGFQRDDQFSKVVDMIVGRCNADLIPKKTRFDMSEVSHWIYLPPLPGDIQWGNEPYEVIEDLCLRALHGSSSKESGTVGGEPDQR